MTPVEPARRSAAPGVARLLAAPAGGLGRVLAVPVGAVARLRRGKPMHPRGVVLEAVLERTGSTPPWGVPWLDDPGRDRALVRLSRGAGLPDRLPDLLGLAVHVPASGTDLLLSSTGRGRLTHLVPRLRRDPATSYGSIMGYRTAAGTLRVAAVGERTAGGGGSTGLVFVLAAVRGAGPWRPFARLVLGAEVPGGDPDVRFDAVRRPPPGLAADGPMARFRAPSYARARVERDPDGAGRL